MSRIRNLGILSSTSLCLFFFLALSRQQQRQRSRHTTSNRAAPPTLAPITSDRFSTWSGLDPGVGSGVEEPCTLGSMICRRNETRKCTVATKLCALAILVKEGLWIRPRSSISESLFTATHLVDTTPLTRVTAVSAATTAHRCASLSCSCTFPHHARQWVENVWIQLTAKDEIHCLRKRVPQQRIEWTEEEEGRLPEWVC